MGWVYVYIVIDPAWLKFWEALLRLLPSITCNLLVPKISKYSHYLSVFKILLLVAPIYLFGKETEVSLKQVCCFNITNYFVAICLAFSPF